MKRSALERAGIVLPARLKAMPCQAAGTLLVRFIVPSRPIPWKSPTVLSTGISFKDKKLVAWQAEVALRARAAWDGGAPYAFPVRLDLTFELTPKAGSPPDTSNLTKAFEDALQGIVIENDRLVVENTARRVAGKVDRATVWVYAAGEP